MASPTSQMPAWNLALRFVLEIAAWTGFAWGGWQLGSWPLGIGLFVATVAAWGTFAVPGDPSRSGKAPVPVSGVVRLVVENSILFGGCALFWAGGAPVVAAVLVALNVLHLAFGLGRVRWLLART